jgi:hypothetical protein
VNINNILPVTQADNTDAPDAPDPPAVVQPEETSAKFGLPFALVIERLELREGNVELEVPALPGVRAVEGLEVHLGGELFLPPG